MPAKCPVWVLLHWQQTTFISSSHGTWGIYNEAGNSHTLNLHDEHQCGYARMCCILAIISFLGLF